MVLPSPLQFFTSSSAAVEVPSHERRGIRAPGARRIPEIVFGVIPQVVPLWTSFIRLETNVRPATTLGGIGQTLYESIRSFNYGDTATQMPIAAVIAIDPIARGCARR